MHPVCKLEHVALVLRLMGVMDTIVLGDPLVVAALIESRSLRDGLYVYDQTHPTHVLGTLGNS